MRGCGEMGKGVRVRVCVCVCERVRKGFCGPRKECVFGKGTCSLSDTEGKAKVFAFVSMGADRKGEHYRVAAHLRLEIIVSLRMAASAEAPLSPILLSTILQSMGKVGAVRGYRSVNGR